MGTYGTERIKASKSAYLHVLLSTKYNNNLFLIIIIIIINNNNNNNNLLISSAQVSTIRFSSARYIFRLR